MDFDAVNRGIVSCEKCPRLRDWCRSVALAKRRGFADWEYWGRPVPNFGDPAARGLIVGLAPAAHGANRTGRMFTGDRSGDWLYRALHRAGLANKPTAESADDGLALDRCLITATCHCAPPDNKPTPEEVASCRVWLESTWALQEWQAVLCLGGIAWTQVFKMLSMRAPKFGHGVEASVEVAPGRSALIFGSYHPSQQNTFTGRLTEQMLDDVVSRFAKVIQE